MSKYLYKLLGILLSHTIFIFFLRNLKVLVNKLHWTVVLLNLIKSIIWIGTNG